MQDAVAAAGAELLLQQPAEIQVRRVIGGLRDDDLGGQLAAALPHQLRVLEPPTAHQAHSKIQPGIKSRRHRRRRRQM